MPSLVTVIIPTYNTEPKSLARTINSVIEQTYSSLEIIVVDDGGSVPFSGLEKQISDPRLIWLKMDKNAGVATARNRGLEIAKGDFIAFLDAGDWWESEKIALQVIKFNQSPPNTVLIYTAAKVHSDSGVEWTIHPSKKGDLKRDLLVGQPITGSASSVLIRKNALNRSGFFYTEEDCAEDRELWYRLSTIGHFDYLEKPLVHIERLIGKSRSQKIEEVELAFYKFIQLHEKDLVEEKLINHAVAKYHITIGNLALTLNSPIQGLKHFCTSLYYKPAIFPFKRFTLALFSCLVPSFYQKMISKTKNEQDTYKQ